MGDRLVQPAGLYVEDAQTQLHRGPAAFVVGGVGGGQPRVGRGQPTRAVSVEVEVGTQDVGQLPADRMRPVVGGVPDHGDQVLLFLAQPGHGPGRIGASSASTSPVNAATASAAMSTPGANPISRRTRRSASPSRKYEWPKVVRIALVGSSGTLSASNSSGPCSSATKSAMLRPAWSA